MPNPSHVTETTPVYCHLTVGPVKVTVALLRHKPIMTRCGQRWPTEEAPGGSPVCPACAVGTAYEGRS